MKYFKSSIFLFVFLQALSANAQQIFQSEGWGNTHQTEKSKLVIPLFVLNSDTIYPFEQFGVSESSKAEAVKIKVPKTEANKALAYSFFYSGAASNGKGGYVPMIISNYQRRRNEHPIIWIDRNQNFDFTDDGPADTFHQYRTFIDIIFVNPQNSEQKTITRLGRFDFEKDRVFAKMTDQFFRLYQGPRVFVGTMFSFKEYRFMIKEVPVWLESDTFKIGLYDQNFNGIFNDEGADLILTSSIDNEQFEGDRNFEIKNKQAEIERRLKYYQIRFLDSYGQQIELVQNLSGKESWAQGQKMPRFSYQSADGKVMKIRRFRRKSYVVYFWERGVSSFEQDTTALRTIHELYGKKVEVIMLNFGENPALLKYFVEFNKIPYRVGTSTKEILRKYKVDSFPMVYYVGKWRRFEGVYINVQNTLEKINQQNR